jgi:hypothetical protein
VSTRSVSTSPTTWSASCVALDNALRRPGKRANLVGGDNAAFRDFDARFKRGLLLAGMPP